MAGMSSLVPAIARRWPFANGSGRILDMFAGRVDLGAGVRVAATSDGFPVQVYADDLIGRHLLMSGKFDRSVLDVLLRMARNGDTFLDIGANIGYYSSVFLHNVKNSRAVCFEPQPGVVDLLKANVGQFEGRAEVRQVGLAAQEGELRFHIDPHNRGASRFCASGELSIKVEDAAKVFSQLKRVDLMKVDVEGFEEPIFRAIEDQLVRLKPRAILFEDQTKAAAPTGALGLILRRAGYVVQGIDKRLLKTRLVKIDSAADCRFNDYLAVR
jgi:FkbM family methyltransferase